MLQVLYQLTEADLEVVLKELFSYSNQLTFGAWMVAGGGCWWLVVVGGGWWLLVVVGGGGCWCGCGGWWWLVVVGGGWWWLLVVVGGCWWCGWGGGCGGWWWLLAVLGGGVCCWWLLVDVVGGCWWLRRILVGVCRSCWRREFNVGFWFGGRGGWVTVSAFEERKISDN